MYLTSPRGLGASPKVPKEEAKRAVQAIYLELLLRDPWDPYDSGAEGYVHCLTEGWCTTDFVRTEVIKSPEYRDKELQRAQKVYATAPAPATPGAPLNVAPSAAGIPLPLPEGAGVLGLTVGGIPIVYVGGALLVLALLLRRR